MLKQNTAVICLSKGTGGVEIDSLKFAKKLCRYSNIVFIAKHNSFIQQSYDKYITAEDGIALETIDFNFNFSLNIIKKTRYIIEKYKVRNVVFFGTRELKSLFFAFIGFDINLIMRHGTTRTTPRKHLFHRMIYNNVNYHVSISKHVENCIKHVIPFGPATESVMIYSSVKNYDFKKEKNKTLTFLHIGRVLKAKGQEDAIRACKILTENNIDFRFYIVGDQEQKYSKEFMSFYENLSYKDKIVLIGPTHNIEKYLKKSDIFLFPSYGEGMPNAFLEALSSGLTCVAYENTCFPELKNLGFDFEMIENKNIDNLANAILSIAKGESNYNIEKNKQVVQSLLNEEIEINRYLDLLK